MPIELLHEEKESAIQEYAEGKYAPASTIVAVRKRLQCSLLEAKQAVDQYIAVGAGPQVLASRRKFQILWHLSSIKELLLSGKHTGELFEDAKRLEEKAELFL